MKKKIIYFIILFGLITVSIVLSQPRLSKAATPPTAPGSARHLRNAPTIGDAFVGERFSYTISFWIFDNIAAGSIMLKKGEKRNEYIATLEAHTTGLLSRFLKPRSDTYTTRLTMVDGGKRFITSHFEKNVHIGEKVRRSVQEVDYEKGELRWTTYKHGKVRRTGGTDIPPGERYDGPLTAFYNLRYGVYGPIEGGRSYHIKTLPKGEKPVSDIEIRIASERELNKFYNGDKKDPRARYYAVAVIDKEFFDSRTGEVEIIFNADLVPLYAVARNVMMYGDIRGKLKTIEYEKD